MSYLTTHEYQTDPKTFNNFIRDKYGPTLQALAEIYFERAVVLSNAGLYESAMKDAEFSLSLAGISTDDLHLPYLIGLLGDICIATGNKEMATHYWKYGINLFDPEDPDYLNDIELFLDLKIRIDGMET